jgi:hypothetical protein
MNDLVSRIFGWKGLSEDERVQRGATLALLAISLVLGGCQLQASGEISDLREELAAFREDAAPPERQNERLEIIGNTILNRAHEIGIQDPKLRAALARLEDEVGDVYADNYKPKFLDPKLFQPQPQQPTTDRP